MSAQILYVYAFFWSLSLSPPKAEKLWKKKGKRYKSSTEIVARKTAWKSKKARVGGEPAQGEYTEIVRFLRLRLVDCESPPRARNRCDVRGLLNNETLRLRGATLLVPIVAIAIKFCEFRVKPRSSFGIFIECFRGRWGENNFTSFLRFSRPFFFFFMQQNEPFLP